jgi:hypothetical protein
MLARSVVALALGLCGVLATSGNLALGNGAITFPDGSVQSTAAAGRRAYYQTFSGFAGGLATIACDPGFHMASIWELESLAGLRYDTTRGRTAADSGEGPPIFAAWIRTGTSDKVSGGPGIANCDAWTTSSSGASGTVAGLDAVQGAGVFVPGTAWFLQSPTCNGSKPVWCIED